MIQRADTEHPSGKGAILSALESSRPGERARTARMLHKLLSRSKVTREPEFWQPIIEQLSLIARTSCDRDATAAAKVLAQLRAQDIGIVIHLDKNERLDAGKPTERVAVAFDFEDIQPIHQVGRN